MLVPATPTVVFSTVIVYVTSSPSSGVALSTDLLTAMSKDLILIVTAPELFPGTSSVSFKLVRFAVFTIVGKLVNAPASTVAWNVNTAFAPPAILAIVQVKPVVSGFVSSLDVPPAILAAT